MKKSRAIDGKFLPDGIRPGVFFFGDNLEGLQKLASESVDLVYLDPPFNSKKQWSGVVQDSREQTKVAFKDTWTMGDIKPEWLNRIGAKEQYDALREVAEAVRATAGERAQAYILYMAIRLIEMHRVLKPTGSIYYHCDPVMSHSVKLLMDSVFGASNFRNEIVWYYAGPARVTKHFPRKHDTLFLYSKGKSVVFNKTYGPLPEYLHNRARKDPDGRLWVDQRLGELSDNKIRQMKKEGRVFETQTGGLRRKQYLDEMSGAQVNDVWELPIINSQAEERLGYPTQKPEALLERIILASTNEGDVVLDPFAGSGTACAVAEKLNRLRIGMDLNETAAITSTLRLQKIMDERRDKKAAEPLLLDGSEDINLVLEQGAAESIKNAASLPDAESEETARGAHWRARLCEKALRRQHGRCMGCGMWSADSGEFECDHIEPKSRGGLLTEQNTQALCRKCNGKKGSGTMAKLWAGLEESGHEWPLHFWHLASRAMKGKSYAMESVRDANRRYAAEKKRKMG